MATIKTYQKGRSLKSSIVWSLIGLPLLWFLLTQIHYIELPNLFHFDSSKEQAYNCLGSRVNSNATGAKPRCLPPRCIRPPFMTAPPADQFKKFYKPGETVAKDAAVLNAAPWLFPPRSPMFSYIATTDLEGLAASRAQPFDTWEKTISVLLFSKAFAPMVQNTVYTMAKFAQVDNYIALTWTAPDLEACLDLNLPCADVSSLFEFFNIKGSDLGEEAEYQSPLYMAIVWLKPLVALTLLKQGYVVHITDTDIAYTTKPLWKSYMTFIEEASVDLAGTNEYGCINGGNYVALPTPAAIKMFEIWVNSSHDFIGQKLGDQEGLATLGGQIFSACDRKFCKGGQRNEVKARMGLFPSAQFSIDADVCALRSAEHAPFLTPCHFTVLFVHPVCASGTALKQRILEKLGFWFVESEFEDDVEDGDSAVQRCLPLLAKYPDIEDVFYSCNEYELGLVYRPITDTLPVLIE